MAYSYQAVTALAGENKWPAFELQWPGSTFDPFTSLIKFFKLSNFDHGVRRRKGHSSTSPPTKRDASCPNFNRSPQLVFPPSSGPAARRASTIACCSGPSGFDYRTFECQKCGCVETMAVSRDPMTSDMLGWLAGELKPPT